MNSDEWMEELDTPFFPEDSTGERRKLSFLGYFPCPIRGQIRSLIHRGVQEYSVKGEVIPWYVPGGCGGHDIYEGIWEADDPSELPEVILSLDFGDFWRPEFRKRFVERGLFEPVWPSKTNPAFESAGLTSISLGYTLFAVHPTALLVDSEKLAGRPLPNRWADILDPAWAGDLSLGGGKDSIDTTVLLHIWKHHGDSGIKALARNVRPLRHSAQMAKLTGSGNPEGTAISIMPLFFADSCPHRDKTAIVIPSEGAIANPIYVLAQRGRGRGSRMILDLLFSPDASAVCQRNRFPPAFLPASISGQPAARPETPRLNWLGWDFLLGQDLPRVKQRLEDLFRSDWRGAAG